MWSDYDGVADRFDRFVDQSGDCHLWTGARAGGKARSYGTFKLSHPVRRDVYAHRVAMERKIGRELRKGEMVMHSCDTPLCVNPDHLSLGNQAANMAGAAARGRTVRGIDHVFAKLSEQDVLEIRALLLVPGTVRRTIAERYGVSTAAIAAIAMGRNWKHVQLPAVSRASESVTLAWMGG